VHAHDDDRHRGRVGGRVESDRAQRVGLRPPDAGEALADRRALGVGAGRDDRHRSDLRDVEAGAQPPRDSLETAGELLEIRRRIRELIEVRVVGDRSASAPRRECCETQEQRGGGRAHGPSLRDEGAKCPGSARAASRPLR
jgi:hypothetical protein